MTVNNVLERSMCQLPVLKVRPASECVAAFGELGPLWYAVHWANDRQHLCCGSDVVDCPLCVYGASRVVGMTLVTTRLQAASKVFLLEVSPIAWGQFSDRCRFGDFVLADGVEAKVTRPRARGCLRIEPLVRVDEFASWLDAERRLLRAWAVLYGLPLPSLTETFEEFFRRVLSVVEARARIAADTPRK